MIDVNVNNEYGRLLKVLVASIDTFKLHPPINKTQEYYYKVSPPDMDKMIKQQRYFIQVLQNAGVEVIFAPRREDCTNQINTRDVGFSIGKSFVVSAMKERERQNEHLALEEIVKQFNKSVKVFRPQNVIIEGGDIILDNGRIFVGISERTDNSGVEWLKQNFADFNIIPIKLKKTFLHLDVVFNILAGGYALVCVDGVEPDSMKTIRSMYDVIETEPSEQISLATNIVSLSPNLVVCDSRNQKTNKKISAIGKNIIEVQFDEISKIGGSFRCSTCPLERGNVL